jgi:hypothetical protein
MTEAEIEALAQRVAVLEEIVANLIGGRKTRRAFVAAEDIRQGASVRVRLPYELDADGRVVGYIESCDRESGAATTVRPFKKGDAMKLLPGPFGGEFFSPDDI